MRSPRRHSRSRILEGVLNIFAISEKYLTLLPDISNMLPIIALPPFPFSPRARLKAIGVRGKGGKGGKGEGGKGGKGEEGKKGKGEKRRGGKGE